MSYGQAARRHLVQPAAAIDTMRHASAIRELVGAVRRSRPDHDPEVTRWQGWALVQAEALDPMRGGNLTFNVPG